MARLHTQDIECCIDVDLVDADFFDDCEEDVAWQGMARRGEAWQGMARRGEDSFNNLTDSQLLSMSKETERTTPGAIERRKENEGTKVSDYERSTPHHAQRSDGKPI